MTAGRKWRNLNEQKRSKMDNDDVLQVFENAPIPKRLMASKIPPHRFISGLLKKTSILFFLTVTETAPVSISIKVVMFRPVTLTTNFTTLIIFRVQRPPKTVSVFLH